MPSFFLNFFEPKKSPEIMIPRGLHVPQGGANRPINRTGHGFIAATGPA
jgi:hypothetical protein